MVLDRTGEFAGLLDGSQILEGMLTCRRANSAASTGVGALSDAAVVSAAAALTARIGEDHVAAHGSVPAAATATIDDPSAAATDEVAGGCFRQADATSSTTDLAA